MRNGERNRHPRLFSRNVLRRTPALVTFALAVIAVAALGLGCGKKKEGAGKGSKTQKPDTEETRALSKANLASFDYVWTTVKDKHWDKNLGGVDWQAVRDELRPKIEKATTAEEARAVLEEMLHRLGKSHFGIVPATAYEELERPGEAKAAAAGTEPGDEAGSGTTGIDVRVVDGKALVWRVADGSPAAAAGVKPGWLIVEIDGKPVAESISRIQEAFADSTLRHWMFARAVEGRLSGDLDKSAKVVFENGEDKAQTVEVGRAEPDGNRVVMGNMPALYVTYESRKVAPDIGYIAFSAFMDPATTMQSYARDMATFADTRGLIIDLRGNPGGLGGMAMGMGGYFVSDSSKSLGTMTTRDTKLKFVLNPRPNPYKGKVAVLIDGLSGSTSEILAAGLRDLGLARLFGTRSAGAALPSTFERLPNGDGFQYAFGNYVSASGEVLEGKGVDPDQEVQLTREALLAGHDPVIDAAVAWIGAKTDE